MVMQFGSKIREINVNLPASDEDVQSLELGDVVYLNGLIFTSREGAYSQIFDKNLEPPVDLGDLGGATFHCSPAISETEDGKYIIPSVTATASFRFAKYMSAFLKRFNIRFVIGKAGMSSSVYRESFVPNRAIYLTTVGYGLGATYGRGIIRVKDVIWKDELGLAQAVWILEVKEFGPFLVDSNIHGESLFEIANQAVNEKFLPLYEGLPMPTLKRLGEVISPDDEII